MGKRNTLFKSVIAIAAIIAVVCAVALVGCKDPGDGGGDGAVVRYADFGAVGDGKKDDFDAIIKAHEYANEHGLAVKAEFGKIYYIGAHKKTAVIKTDTDWRGASFVIDDSEVEVKDRGWNVFEIKSDTAAESVEIPRNFSLGKGQANIGMTFSRPVMLHIVNDNKKDYIRYGNNQNGGSSRQEIILVDKNGNVSDDTPILWDYDEVTKITAYSVTDSPVTVKGGDFTTIVNTVPVSTNYYARGISVTRSNTTLDGVEHYLSGEPAADSGQSGSPYTGFFAVSSANAVTIKNCVMTGHVVYSHQKPTGWVQQGTYDTTATRANGIAWIGCTQSNSITDRSLWGVMSSNFCKNLLMDGCEISRFDAHQGVYNATVKNSKLGRDFNIIGAGTLTVENVERVSGGQFLWLRSDYGSTWNGDIIFRNCSMTEPDVGFSLLGGSWTDWDFGYECFLPANITVDNFALSGGGELYVFPDAIANLVAASVSASSNPYNPTEKLVIENESAHVELARNVVEGSLLSGTQVERN